MEGVSLHKFFGTRTHNNRLISLEEPACREKSFSKNPALDLNVWSVHSVSPTHVIERVSRSFNPCHASTCAGVFPDQKPVIFSLCFSSDDRLIGQNAMAYQASSVGLDVRRSILRIVGRGLRLPKQSSALPLHSWRASERTNCEWVIFSSWRSSICSSRESLNTGPVWHRDCGKHEIRRSARFLSDTRRSDAQKREEEKA